MRVGLSTMAIFGDLSRYFFANFWDKASNISEVSEEVATQIAKNCRQQHSGSGSGLARTRPSGLRASAEVATEPS